MSVLVLIEHDNKIVKASSLNTITAAKKIDQKVHAIVIGENCKKVSEEVSKFDGIEEVLLADNKIHTNHENRGNDAKSNAGPFKNIARTL